jgi:mxaL protein
MFERLHDPRLGLLAAALIAIGIALTHPTWTSPRAAYDLMFIVDITGSMNARDYMLDGRPASRLQAVKRRLRELIAQLPCGSRAGLGIFTERRSFLLFEPVELCGNFAAVDGAIAALDWRMAWEGDSHIASGLYSAIDVAGKVGADAVFLTDGHEAPPLPHSGGPSFEGEPGKVKGLIIGVGGPTPVPIPRFDDEGHEIGFWSMTDVPQENRSGPPPPDASSRPGYNPRNAPFGAEIATGNEHLTFVHEEYLQTLARTAGLGYMRLADGVDVETALAGYARRRRIETQVDLRPAPAAVALLALVVIFGALPMAGRAGKYIRPWKAGGNRSRKEGETAAAT